MFQLKWKDTGEDFKDETSEEVLMFTTYEDAKSFIEKFGHVGEEFITIINLE